MTVSKDGELKKRIEKLWKTTETINKTYGAIEVHNLKRVLLDKAKLISDEAKKEIFEAFDTNRIETWHKLKKWFGEP